MYFWRIEQLKRKMATTPLTDREVLPYLIVFVGLSSAVWFIPSFFVPNVWDRIGSGISFLLSIFGTIWLFQRNGGARSKYFLQRYLALGWVVAVRWIVVMILVCVLLYSVLDFLDVLSETTSWSEVLLFALAEVAFYWRIGVHMQDLATRAAAV
jgi:hypothetical protein